jgi:hypothetical protein
VLRCVLQARCVSRTGLQMGNLTRALGHNRRRWSLVLRGGNGAHGQVFWSGFSGMIRFCDHEIAS